MRVVMIGTGYVGLVSGTCLSDVGHNVVCVDVDTTKVAALNRGESPIYEPGIEKLMRHNMEHERLQFTTDLKSAIKGAQVIFIAVGTPEGEDGSADLQYVKAAGKSIGSTLNNDALVIVKSTVPVGTCDIVEEVIQQEFKNRKVNFKVSIASNPEFLKEGAAISDFMKPDRIVVGVTDKWSEDILRELFNPFIIVDPGRLQVMSRRSSELTKYASNAMLATRISFMNELSHLCETVGANIDEIRRGIGSDARIGRNFLYAGPGFGGSCFPKDVVALLNTAQKYNVNLAIVEAVDQTNDRQKKRVAEKIVNHFGGKLKDKKIAIWGLAFKPNTDDVREAPAKTIIEILLASGAQVSAHDPEAMETFKRCFGKELEIDYVERPYDALNGADALVLVTEWSEYRQPNWDKIATLMRQKVVFDFRNQYAISHLAEKGFVRFGIGQ